MADEQSPIDQLREMIRTSPLVPRGYIMGFADGDRSLFVMKIKEDVVENPLPPFRAVCHLPEPIPTHLPPDKIMVTTGFRISFRCGSETVIPIAFFRHGPGSVLDAASHRAMVHSECPACGAGATVFSVVDRLVDTALWELQNGVDAAAGKYREDD